MYVCTVGNVSQRDDYDVATFESIDPGYHVAIKDLSRLDLHGELHPMHSVARGGCGRSMTLCRALLKPGMTRHDVAYLLEVRWTPRGPSRARTEVQARMDCMQHPRHLQAHQAMSSRMRGHVG
jgi:hypothetical protein